MHYIANSSSKDADGMSNVVQTVNNLRVAASLEHIEWSSDILIPPRFPLIIEALRRVQAGSGQEISIVSEVCAISRGDIYSAVELLERGRALS